MQESMSSATQLGIYTRFTPKQKATMLAILQVLLWATDLVVDCSSLGTYAASDDVNVPLWNLLVEYDHMRL